MPAKLIRGIKIKKITEWLLKTFQNKDSFFQNKTDFVVDEK